MQIQKSLTNRWLPLEELYSSVSFEIWLHDHMLRETRNKAAERHGNISLMELSWENLSVSPGQLQVITCQP
jgi:hypothetical protein